MKISSSVFGIAAVIALSAARLDAGPILNYTGTGTFTFITDFGVARLDSVFR